MAAFSTPGVYIQEIPKLPASVAQVATAIPAFIGYTELNPSNPIRITSMLEFEQNFGGPQKAVIITKSGSTYSATVTSSTRSNLYYSLQLYFANGGGPCYVASANTFTNMGTATNFTDALAKIGLEDEPTILLSPDSVLLDEDGHENFAKACLLQCATLQDRFSLIDVFATDGTIGNIRTKVGSNNLKYGAVYFPSLITSYSYPDTAVVFNISGNSLNNLTLAEALASSSSSVSAEIIPILKTVRDLVAAEDITLPPSGAIAGIYAAVDASRGVWKAPANVSINGVSGPKVKITDSAQETLNVDPDNGKSINVIRAFTGKGTLVWGARTLAGNDNEWKYVNVRRLFITAEESIKKATAFVVFEPNDANTWVRTKAMIENYLTGLWRDGALAGATPQEAFFVNVGLGTTMTSVDILEGRLNIEIGMAAVRPAEFIILNFSHLLQTS